MQLYNGSATELVVPSYAMVNDERLQVVLSGGSIRIDGVMGSIWSNSDTDTILERIVFEDGIVFPSDSSCMFYSLNNLKTIDLSNVDTSKVTNMESFFSGCGNLSNLDLSSLDTRNVTNMSRMFEYCHSLASIDLSHFDTTKVTDMSRMFFNCSSLIELNISSFNTTNVTAMEGMFNECSSLKELDLSHFDTSNVVVMCGDYRGYWPSIFAYCSNLESLNLDGWDISKLKNVSGMFYKCSSLKKLNLSSFDLNNITSIATESGKSTFLYDCAALEELQTPINCNVEVVLPCEMIKTGFYVTLDDISLYEALPQGLNNSICLILNKTGVTELLCYYIFDQFEGLSEAGYEILEFGTAATYTNEDYETPVDPDTLEIVDLSCVTSYLTVFLIHADYTDWYKTYDYELSDNTPELYLYFESEIPESIFENVPMFTVVDGSVYMTNVCTKWQEDYEYTLDDEAGTITLNKYIGADTEIVVPGIAIVNNNEYKTMLTKVTSESDSIWYNVKDTLISLEIKEPVTILKDTVYMFSGLSKLERLNLTGLDVTKSTAMTYMFKGCSSLVDLDISNFDTSNVTDVSSMFAGCSSLRSLDLSHFKTSQITSIKNMFDGCENLVSLDFSSFNTNIVAMTYRAFANCKSLTELDLSMFDMSSAKIATNMFDGMTSLALLKTPINCNVDVLLPFTMYEMDCAEHTMLPKGVATSKTLLKECPFNYTVTVPVSVTLGANVGTGEVLTNKTVYSKNVNIGLTGNAGDFEITIVPTSKLGTISVSKELITKDSLSASELSQAINGLNIPIMITATDVNIGYAAAEIGTIAIEIKRVTN